MRLYIEIIDGKPINHPLMEDNLAIAYPEVDLDNPGPRFAEFIRCDIVNTIIPVEKKLKGFSYEWQGNVVVEIPRIVDKYPEEIAAFYEQQKEDFYNNTGFHSWSYNEETHEFTPPVPRPTDGKYYKWIEEDQLWVEFDPNEQS